MASIEHLLIHRAKIERVTRAAGSGGAWPETRTTVASAVPCRRAPASASERSIAANEGAIVTHAIIFATGQAVARGDVVTIDGAELVAQNVVAPSVAIYVKVLAEEVQPAP